MASSRFRWTLFNLSDSTTEVLTNDPVGWEQVSLNLKRHKDYHGVFVDFTFNLKWHCEGGGKTFIDNVYETEDINGIIEVLIEISCDGDGTYSELYRGRLNLTSYKNTGEFTEANIEKSSLFSKLIARDEISVDMEGATSIGEEAITPCGTKEIALFSQNIFLKSEMEALQFPYNVSVTNGIVDAFLHRGLFSHQLSVVQEEADNFPGWVDFNDFGNPGNTTNTSLIPEIFEAIDTNVKYAATYTYRLHFSGLFHDILTSAVQRTNNGHTLVLAWGANLADSFALNKQVTLFNGTGYSTTLQDYLDTFDTGILTGNITLNYGDKVWLYWFESITLTSGPYNDTIEYQWNYDAAEFSIEINSVTDGTSAKSVLAHEALNQVCNAIGDSDLRFYSEFYGRPDSDQVTYPFIGCGALVAISNGLNIRRLSDKSIYCSLKELFESLNALHCIGLTIEQYSDAYVTNQDVIRVENRAYFYDSGTQTLNLTNRVKIERAVDTTRYYSKAEMGYNKWETEQAGGLDEPNTKHEYSTKVNAVKGNYTALSKYMASGYAIELTRRKNIENTTDWRYDNDNFFIAVTDGLVNAEVTFVATLNNISLPGIFLGFTIGDSIEVRGSVSNDGIYTITDVVEFQGQTVIEVGTALTTETATIYLQNLTSEVYGAEKFASSFTGGSGMISLTTAFNLRLTPARMLLAHIGSLTACLQKIQGFISFVKGEGNTALQTVMNLIGYVGCQEEYSAQSLSESQSFAWNDSNANNIVPLWEPEVLKFEYPLTASDLAAVRANPHGYIEALDEYGNTVKGYILNVDFMLKTGLTKFELLKVHEP